MIFSSVRFRAPFAEFFHPDLFFRFHLGVYGLILNTRVKSVFFEDMNSAIDNYNKSYKINITSSYYCTMFACAHQVKNVPMPNETNHFLTFTTLYQRHY